MADLNSEKPVKAIVWIEKDFGPEDSTRKIVINPTFIYEDSTTSSPNEPNGSLNLSRVWDSETKIELKYRAEDTICKGCFKPLIEHFTEDCCFGFKTDPIESRESGIEEEISKCILVGDPHLGGDSPIQAEELIETTSKLIGDEKANIIVVRGDDIETEECPKCIVCKKDLAVPARLLSSIQKCGCEYDICVSCIRDTLGLTARFKNPDRNLKCLKCEQRLNISERSLDLWKAHKIYIKDEYRARELDRKFGPVLCVRGCGKTYLRDKAAEHQATCDYSYKPCTNAGCWSKQVRMVDHDKECTSKIMKCVWCHEMDTRHHMTNCSYRPERCRYCNQEFLSKDLYEHESKICEDNPKECKICGYKMIELKAHRVPCIYCFKPCIRCKCGRRFIWMFEEEEYSVIAADKETAVKHIVLFLQSQSEDYPYIDKIVNFIQAEEPLIGPAKVTVPSFIFNRGVLLSP